MREYKNLPPLNLPPVELKFRREDGVLKLFDPLREKYVALTPEEYVRRHFTAWLVDHLHYPKSLVANEVGVRINDMVKRCDTLVADAYGQPLMIVEYKAPGVSVNQAVFDQIVRYNMVLKAKYLVVSNGIHHYCCAINYENGTYNFIPKVPDYNEIRMNDKLN